MEPDTKSKIIEISRELFYKNGYAHTTTREIADAIGLSSPSLFHHFKNKKDILTQIFLEFDDNISKAVNPFFENLSSLERRVLVLKIYLLPLLRDKNLSNLYLEAFNENILNDIIRVNIHHYFNFDHFIDNPQKVEKQNLSVFRYNAFLGTLRENVMNFINGTIEFNEENIHLYLTAVLDLFYNVSTEEIFAAIEKVNKVLKFVAFEGFDVQVVADDVIALMDEHCHHRNLNFKVIFTEDMNDFIIKTERLESDHTIHQFEKVMILTKVYPLQNPFDFQRIEEIQKDFTTEILDVRNVLQKKLKKDFIIASYVADSHLRTFEELGLKPELILRKYELYSDAENITNCALLFYS
ncbi:MAG: TetR/AcrR family transcriptional regulator [Eubacteriaceae bacterium]|nr:TetR/AcrR family transcriptional regulator [Eubacteriaceae bacterium]